MLLPFDPAKNERNIREHGLDFNRVREFDFETARITPVFRNGEHRLWATGYLDDRFHALSDKRTELGIRVISFRKGNAREAKRYGFTLRRQPNR